MYAVRLGFYLIYTRVLVKWLGSRGQSHMYVCMCCISVARTQYSSCFWALVRGVVSLLLLFSPMPAMPCLTGC